MIPFSAPINARLAHIGPYIVYRPKRVPIVSIQRRVAAHYGIPPAEMVSPLRSRKVARPRQVAMVLSRQFTPLSLPEIGRRFGGRDHTTVLHAIRQIKKLAAEDAELRADVDALARELSR